jgi:hypothetical protein
VSQDSLRDVLASAALEIGEKKRKRKTKIKAKTKGKSSRK